jgi:GAF domain-containing protein
MADSELSADLHALSLFFVGDGTLEETLTRVADLTVEAVPAADFAGITMMVEGKKRTAIFTDDTAPEIDQTQYDSGSGPCVDAFEQRRITAIDSTRAKGRWSEFRNAAAAKGVLSTLSLPLVVDNVAVGAMNLYSRRERAFSERDAERGALFAAQAAIVLANSHAYWDARHLSEDLSKAMKHRAVIEQAKGMLMAAQGVDEDEAFNMLVRASQRENVKLRDVAQRMVTKTIARGRSDGADSNPEP